MFQSKKRKKNITLGVICFVLGLLIAFIPSLFYICSLQNDGIPPLRFTPNAVAERKPTYLQMIKTQEQVNQLKKISIYMSNLVSIGAGLAVGMHGLDIYSAKELKNPEFHLKNIGKQINKEQIINGYHFIPDTILTVAPSNVQILYNQHEVNAAKKMKNLNYKQYLEIGAVINCPSQSPCAVISKLKTQKVLTLKPFPYQIVEK